jgi:hypothetical protein
MANSLDRNRNGGTADATERSEASTGQSAAAAEASFAEGGCLSNTHPQTSQVAIEGYPDCFVSGGFDWLEWGAFVEWNPFSGPAMMMELDWFKRECQEEKQSDKFMTLMGLVPIRVFRRGMNRGGDRGQQFEYKISYRGVNIGLANREKPNGSNPNLFVRQRGRECLLLGARESFEAVRDFIAALGAKIISDKITRVDFCLDLAGVPIEALQGPVERHQFIRRAKHVRPASDLVSDTKSGFSAGQNPLHLTVYDKLAEQAGKGDKLYLQALIDRRWGGELPTAASRIEFQVSRPWLKDNGIDSTTELFQHAGSIVEKLTTKWFRLTTEPIDRASNHQSRATTLPLWTNIQNAFVWEFGQPTRSLVPIERKQITAEHLGKQARGCLISALLQMGVRCTSYDDFVEQAGKVLWAIAGDDNAQIEFVEEFWCRESEHVYEPYQDAA